MLHKISSKYIFLRLLLFYIIMTEIEYIIYINIIAIQYFLKEFLASKYLNKDDWSSS